MNALIIATSFLESIKGDILASAIPTDTFWLFVEDGIIRGNGNGLVAMKTKLG